MNAALGFLSGLGLGFAAGAAFVAAVVITGRRTRAAPRRDLFDDPVTDSEWAEIFQDSDGIGTDDVDLAHRLTDHGRNLLVDHAFRGTPLRGADLFMAQWLHLTPLEQHTDVRKSASALTPQARAELARWFPLPPEADAGSHS